MHFLAVLRSSADPSAKPLSSDTVSRSSSSSRSALASGGEVRESENPPDTKLEGRVQPRRRSATYRCAPRARPGQDSPRRRRVRAPRPSSAGVRRGAVLRVLGADPSRDLHDQRDREPEQHGAPGDPHAGPLSERPRGDQADLPGVARRRAKVACSARVLARGPGPSSPCSSATAPLWSRRERRRCHRPGLRWAAPPRAMLGRVTPGLR